MTSFRDLQFFHFLRDLIKRCEEKQKIQSNQKVRNKKRKRHTRREREKSLMERENEMEERPAHLEDLCRHDPPIRGGGWMEKKERERERERETERRVCGYSVRTHRHTDTPP
jgi:hypothetical protein